MFRVDLQSSNKCFVQQSQIIDHCCNIRIKNTFKTLPCNPMYQSLVSGYNAICDPQLKNGKQ